MATTKKTRPGSEFKFVVDLARDYRLDDVMSFHGRDKEAISEQVTDTTIRKGVVVDGKPAAFEIEFDLPGKTAKVVVHADGKLSPTSEAGIQEIATKLLGLRLNPDEFRRFVAKDAVFGPLTKRQKHLRIVQSPSIFEALTWAVMGQQINVSFAVSLRRTFVQLGGVRHSSGLWCYPEAADAAAININDLTSRQFSRSKAETLLRLANLVADNQIDLVESPGNTIDTISESLLEIKGIGPWTVNYALLRGYGHADCSLHGDVAVRAAIANLWKHETRPSIADAEVFLRQYSPHRTMAAAHLWASLSAKTSY